MATPMLGQWQAVKTEYPDCLLFFRLGDFYEMFYEDALEGSRLLEITLTARDAGEGKRAPMCGVPYHSVDSYVKKLIRAGKRVAICEQMEDPATAKGIVKREVIRVITPGTVSESEYLDGDDNNFLMSIYLTDAGAGYAVCDSSTGEFMYGECAIDSLQDVLTRYTPKECLMNGDYEDASGTAYFHPSDSYYDEAACMEMIIRQFPADTGLSGTQQAKFAAGSLLRYLNDMQKRFLFHIREARNLNEEEYLYLNANTVRNLELLENLHDNKRHGSLLWAVDKTKTSMGRRTVKRWMLFPSLNLSTITNRQDAVEELLDNGLLRMSLREHMIPVGDMERIIAKVSCQTANARDLLGLKNSMAVLPEVKSLLGMAASPLLSKMREELDTLEDVYALLDSCLHPEPPISVREGNLIRPGYNEEVDRLRDMELNGKDWVLQLEAREKEATGIKNLKVKFNRVFGYSIEVSKSQTDLVPAHYIRKQTLVNGERYITEELKEYERQILSAGDRLKALEYELFCEVRQKVLAENGRILRTAQLIGELDTLCGLGEAAADGGYVKPQVSASGSIEIRDGRHPVVEKLLKDKMFVPNDTSLNAGGDNLHLITGPNMSGKSTYMRQIAHIVILAQMGSFVPARSCEIGICDKIFTRIGASDNLTGGRSTFMVEMEEVAEMLRDATPKSLILLDEVGRGTSTFDGLSIAWAMVEHIQANLRARTLFATHFHELTALAYQLDGVKNMKNLVKEDTDTVTFLHRIVPGASGKSYGIHVAELAGLPVSLMQRARELLERVEKNSTIVMVENDTEYPAEAKAAVNVCDNPYESMAERLSGMDIYSMTPMEAMNVLKNLIDEVRAVRNEE